LAEERTAANAPAKISSTRPARHRSWWRPAAFGTLAAAALAGVLIAPQFLTPRAPPKSASAPAQVSQPKAAASPEAPVEIKEQLSGSAAAERTPAPPEAQGNAAPASDSAAAKNAPTKAQSMAKVENTSKARSGAATSNDSETDARRTQTITSPASRMLAAPRAAAPVPQELAAELRRAAEIGDVPTLQSLLGRQPVIDARDESGRTALMLATLHGQAAAVDALLARGADPNAADARGMTPLQAAVAGNQPAIVAALQRAGAR